MRRHRAGGGRRAMGRFVRGRGGAAGTPARTGYCGLCGRPALGRRGRSPARLPPGRGRQRRRQGDVLAAGVRRTPSLRALGARRVSEGRRGTLLGLAAYLVWGLFPLYWPLLEPAGAVEILAHRVLWSLVLVGVLLLTRTRTRALRTLPRDRRALSLLLAAAVLIAVNWGVYIWGVNSHHVVETSLGYFVNPLVSVALGVA